MPNNAGIIHLLEARVKINIALATMAPVPSAVMR